MAVKFFIIHLFLLNVFIHSGVKYFLYQIVGSVVFSYNFAGLYFTVVSINCHQCSSLEDRIGQDACGAYRKFDVTQNVPVDCDGEESVTPGTFCVKITIQGPESFVWCKTYSYTFHINLLHN